jgi:hypothetical protein
MMKTTSRNPRRNDANVKLAPIAGSNPTNQRQPPDAVGSGGDGQLMDVIQEWMGKLQDATRNGQLMPIEATRSRLAVNAPSSSSANTNNTISPNLHSGGRADPSKRTLRKSSDLRSVTSASVSGSVSSLAASAYGHSIITDGMPMNKLNSMLLQIGRAVHELVDVDAIYDISTRGRIDNMLGPLELQARLISLFHLHFSSPEIQLLMKRFGTAGVNHDRVDLHELLAWARSAFERNKERISYESIKKKTRREVKQLMVRNNVMSKIERNKLLEAEFQKKIELKLSLAALAILEGNDKAATMLETTETYVNSVEFKEILGHMSIFLSNLEFSCLVNAFIIDMASPGGHYHQHKTKWNSNASASSNLSGAEIVNFDGFRGYMVGLMRESADSARQGRAVKDFKQALSDGKAPPLLLPNRSADSVPIRRGISGVIAEEEYEGHENYENDVFDAAAEQVKFSSILEETNLAVEARNIRKGVGRFNNGPSALKPIDRKANSIKLLYDDSISIQDVNQFTAAELPGMPPSLSPSSASAVVTPSKASATVKSVLSWISDPLNSLDSKRLPLSGPDPHPADNIQLPLL